jgi:signal transduction histidine kinase
MNALRSQYDEHIRQAARVEERTRLARDLHDAVKQQLFAIQTSAATAEARLASDAAGARSAIEQVRASARDALTEMKALIEQLQTSPVENTGLVVALRQQCEALELRTGARVVLEMGALPRNGALPPGGQQALFRAAQEALSNIARHARATRVTVRLALSGDNLDLTVEDNGAGFDPMADRAGMGIDNMKARVCDVSGTFVLRTAPGEGTLVGFSVPCDIRTSRDYAWKALSWAAVLMVMALSFTIGSHWERPWKAIFALIAAITAARYAAAWHRVRTGTAVAA